MRRIMVLAGGFFVAMTVALVLNELFGMPPVFTSHPPEPSPFAGVWTGSDVTLSIAPDGSVFGVAGKDQIYRANISGNRTWVGRALNWRTDYIIMGRAGEHRFTAPFNVRDGRLDGSFFVFRGEVKPPPAKLLLERKS